MTVTLDASVAVAALLDTGEVGRRAERLLAEADLAAPHLMPVEASNIIRRHTLRGEIDERAAAAAHDDLVALGVELFDFLPLADRIWELHANITAYDAWYVALAEALDAPLVTLDARLASTPGPRCTIRVL